MMSKPRVRLRSRGGSGGLWSEEIWEEEEEGDVQEEREEEGERKARGEVGEQGGEPMIEGDTLVVYTHIHTVREEGGEAGESVCVCVCN